MAQERLPPGKKHRLEIYYRIGQRMRMGPLLMGLVGLVLLGYTYLPQIITFMPTLITFLPPTIIEIMWLGPARRALVLALLLLSGALYVVNIFVSRASIVQARPEYLYVRAGLIPLAISYARLRSLRPVRVGNMHPRRSLKGSGRAVMEPLLGETAVAVDLQSFPMNEKLLRRLWVKYMFITDRKGLMLLVRDHMGLTQEIDSHRQRYMERRAGRGQTPKDVFERVASEHSDR